MRLIGFAVGLTISLRDQALGSCERRLPCRTTRTRCHYRYRLARYQAIALEAEEAGFDAIFAAEVTGAGYHPRCR